ncbi:MAG: FadR/GntR family transcriptional regulator, partial [Pontimonas sp.]
MVRIVGQTISPNRELMTFQPITRNTVSAQIREQLLRMITTGELSPGARVPSERELSEEFEVARTSVREAIQGLLSMGLIERRGNRTWVAEHLPDVAV